MERRDTSSSRGAHLCEEPIENLVSKRKRPDTKLKNTRETEEMIKKCKTASENHTSKEDGLGMHNHPVFSKTVYEMKAEPSEEAAPATELVPKNHTKKDRPLVDKRAKVETSSTGQSVSDESDFQSQIGSTATGTSCHQFNAADIETAAPYIHGLESMRMTRLEAMLESLKQDIKELKRGIDMLLQVYGIDPTTLQPMVPPATPAKDTI